MQLRILSIFCASMVFGGCGGEGGSAPPPEYPTSSGSSPASEQSKKAEDTASIETAVKPEPNPPIDDQPGQDTSVSRVEPPGTMGDKGVTMEKTTDKPVEADIPGANITMGRMDADGVVATNIQCKSDGGGGGLGLLGAVLVTAWISPQKKALDACAPSGQAAETRIIWTAKGGKMVAIEAKGDAKVKACVEKALRPGKPVFDGKCAATVAYGKK